MFANERQNKIYYIIRNDGAITTAKLVDMFGVSVETVRRDLLAMEKHGLLTRVHGGAVAKGDMQPFLELKERNKKYSANKSELSEKAVEFVEEGDVIGIDCGSTAISFAESLKEKFTSLTVVTHSLDVFEILRNHRQFRLILCGGYYMHDENAFYGSFTLDMLDKLHVKKSFVFPWAISIEYGIFDYCEELYQVQNKLISISDEVYILADSSKFEKTGLLKFADMKSNYTYITDSNLKDEMVKLYKENDIKIHLGNIKK